MITLSQTHAQIGRTLSRPTNKNRFSRYLSLYRQRRALAQLDTHLLEDIGISRETANTEAERPIWDAPTHWFG